MEQVKIGFLGAVNCQMQLSPYTTAFLAMLFDFTLAFTEDLQPGGNQCFFIES